MRDAIKWHQYFLKIKEYKYNSAPIWLEHKWIYLNNYIFTNISADLVFTYHLNFMFRFNNNQVHYDNMKCPYYYESNPVACLEWSVSYSELYNFKWRSRDWYAAIFKDKTYYIISWALLWLIQPKFQWIPWFCAFLWHSDGRDPCF